MMNPNSPPTLDPYVYRALARTHHIINTTDPKRLTAFGIFVAVDGVPQFMEIGGDIAQVYAFAHEMAGQASALLQPTNATVN